MKYTKLERNWVMYDVGNSALVAAQYLGGAHLL